MKWNDYSGHDNLLWAIKAYDNSQFPIQRHAMTRVIIEKSLRAKLVKLKQQAELCDEAGQTIGLFFPYEPQVTKLPPDVESPISDEELERRLKEPGGCSLAEIWAELEKS